MEIKSKILRSTMLVDQSKNQTERNTYESEH
jgi:hypothetical protein